MGVVEGLIEVCGGAGLETAQIFFEVVDFVRRRQRQEEFGLSLKRDECDVRNPFAVAGEFNESAHGRDPQVVRVGLPHAGRGIDDQDNVDPAEIEIAPVVDGKSQLFSGVVGELGDDAEAAAAPQLDGAADLEVGGIIGDPVLAQQPCGEVDGCLVAEILELEDRVLILLCRIELERSGEPELFCGHGMHEASDQ